MTKLSTFVSAISIMFLFTACGLQEGEDFTDTSDGGDAVCLSDMDCAEGDVCNADGVCVPADDGSTQDFLPDPFRSPAANVLDFSSRYVSGSSCGEVRGTLPGMTWESGMYIEDTDSDGYIGMRFDSALPPGTYDISYVGFQNCDDGTPGEAWGQYGHETDLARMSPEGLAFIHCNWYDEASGEYINDEPNPSCHIRIAVDADGSITGAGNMGNFNE